MRRIVVINQKGGVGKTTTAANLGAALARSGRRVLLLDLDPQGHLSLHFGVELGDEQNGAYDILTNGTPIHEAVVPVGDNTWLVPADIDLAAAETELVSVTGREVILREAMDRIDRDYDVAIIDCPPSFGVLTINALCAAREVIIPLQAQFFALQGMSKLFDTVTLVRQRINPLLEVSGIVLCMHESTTRLAGEVVADLTEFLIKVRKTHAAWSDARLFNTAIRRNIKLAEASSFGKTIFDYAPRSHGAADYENLALEVLEDRSKGGKALEEDSRISTPRSAVPPSTAPVPTAPPSTRSATVDTGPRENATSRRAPPSAGDSNSGASGVEELSPAPVSDSSEPAVANPVARVTACDSAASP